MSSNIGEMLFNRRKELKLTLDEVGQAVGVGKSTVRKWENGMIKEMKRDKIALLAKVLQLDPAAFFGQDLSDFNNSLNDIEVSLIKRFRNLSPDGKRHVLDQLEFAEIKYGEKYSDLQKEAN